MEKETLDQLCKRLRLGLLNIELETRAIKDMLLGEQAEPVHNQPEVIAQSMLAVRHIEDARMRLGKVVQHARDGVSIYDQGATTPQP